MEINFGFSSPEEIMKQIASQRKEQAEAIQRMKADKMCVLCKNAMLINDQVAICEKTKECVNDTNGQSCDFWDVLEE